MRERGEWGRQALSWLSWEPLAPCVLGPVLPPLSINLQWQLHCLPNPPRILGDDWPAPLCSINLWPPALRHQSQARGSGLADPSNRLDTCLMTETQILSHRGNLCTKMYLSWTLKAGITYSYSSFHHFTICSLHLPRIKRYEIVKKWTRRKLKSAPVIECGIMHTHTLMWKHTPLPQKDVTLKQNCSLKEEFDIWLGPVTSWSLSWLPDNTKPPIKLQTVIFILQFLYGLDKRDITC